MTAGTRAEREFKRMRDEVREQAAGEFDETMREMRDKAQELDERQQALSDQITDLQKSDSGSLRSPQDRDEIRDAVSQQRDKLGELLSDMERTVEEAEFSEPLLAEKLYDSFRRTRQRQVEQKLEVTEQLLQRGLDPQALEIQQAAQEGISQLRQEIDEASESVLGDPTESLRRALGELGEISEQLNDEIQRNDPHREQEERSASGRSDEDQNVGSNSRSDDMDRERTEPERQNGAGQEPRENSQPVSDSQRGSRDSAQDRSDERQASNATKQPSNDVERSDESVSKNDSNRQPQQDSEASQQQSADSQDAQRGDQSSERQSSQQDSRSPQQASQNQSLTDGQRDGQQRDGQQRDGVSENQMAQPRDGQQSERQDNGSNNSSPSAIDQIANDTRQGAVAPLTGDGYRQWSDRLRDIEEMVDDPQLRSQAIQIREAAREIRIDFKRHSKSPEWNMVRDVIARPLEELKQQVF